jgi:hypothetical protein
MGNQFSAIWAAIKAAPKNPIMNYEQLLSSVFSCFHGQKFRFLKKILHCSVCTILLLNIKKKKNYRLTADWNPAGKSIKKLWRHLFFLVSGVAVPWSNLVNKTKNASKSSRVIWDYLQHPLCFDMPNLIGTLSTM